MDEVDQFIISKLYHGSLVICSFNCSTVVMCKKKRKASSEPGARDDYIDMQYDAKTESLKKPCSQTTSPLDQHYTKPPMTAVQPTKGIELKENEEFAEDA